VLRALACAVAVAACAQAPVDAPTTTPSVPAAPTILSPLAQQVRDELAALDAELSAPGVVTAGYGQLADLGEGLTVRPIAVVEDSRCPGNTRCLWAGRLRIRALVSGHESVLTLGETIVAPSGAVALVAVSPGAWAEWPSDELGPRPAYRFGFRRG
jgi:hypothetical protein